MLKKNKYLLFLLSILLIASCNKKDFEGKEIVIASDAFTIITDLEVSDNSPDFNSEAIHFTAKFSEEVTATLVLKGLESGAEKSFIIGKTNELSETNTLWNGTHDGLYFFRTGEKVVSILSFYGSEIVQYDTLMIASSLVYSDDIHFPLQGGGFEDNTSNGPIKYPDWILYGNESFVDVSSVVTGEIIQVQGSQSFKMAANATTAGYQGGMDNEVAIWNGTEADPVFLPLPADPDSVYFSIYLYGTGESADKIVVEFKEADGDNETNLNGRDDGVQIIQSLGHTGWQLFTYKYSTLPFSTYVPGGGNGNKIHEPHRIVRVAYSLEVTETVPRYGEAIFDYSIFTVGRPFDPSKF